MRTAVWIVVWIVCVLLGAFVGYLAGYGLWKLGFEIIGSAVALVGAGVGGILMFLGVLSWYERRDTARA
ncbi:MAG: hypothetical protein JO352_10305 [Chloroflexi bacterium]|nr:hypothetical protein [Chloroflexota bacterium]MBV9603237.1 hypothetical protein [Chloroflexota bacterium]